MCRYHLPEMIAALAQAADTPANDTPPPPDAQPDPTPAEATAP